MWAFVKVAATIVGGGYLLLCAFLYFGQRGMMYFPSREQLSPQSLGLPDMVEVPLQSAAGDSLISWWLRPPADGPVILFFHGNGGSVAGRAHRFADWAGNGFGVFALGYPGYGGSSGQPSEPALLAAAEKAHQWLLDEGVAEERIVIYGESLGSAVAVQLASGRRARALVLEAPMSAALDIGKSHYPWLPLGLLMKDRWLSRDYIGTIEVPLLVLHGDRDRIIPISSGRDLFELAPQPKQFVTVAGAGHNDLSQHGLTTSLLEFLAANPLR